MENFLGEIRIFAGNFAPLDWAFCNGQLLAISQYDALFTLIGTTYGGDGQNTFALPNLQSQIPVGQGTGLGLSPRVLGQVYGQEGHTLTQTEMPSHNHPAVVTAGAATTTVAGPTVRYGTVSQPNNTLGVYALYTSLTPPDVQTAMLQANTIAASGGSQPHNNIMLTTAVSFIIALTGIYPTQS